MLRRMTSLVRRRSKTITSFEETPKKNRVLSMKSTSKIFQSAATPIDLKSRVP